MSAGLDGVYRDVLNRAPRSDEEGYYDDQLANGRFLADIRRELAYSPEARVDIDGLYQQILGRAADAGGMGYYEENLATGASTLGAILTELAHSPEAGGDIDAIYHQVAGRGASEEEIALYQGALGLGIGWTLGGVRWDISHSAPATAAIGGVYQQMLGHSWNDYNLLLAYEGNMGASWIQWTLNEVRWDLAHRPEATQGIVDLYQQILGRAPIQAEIDVYENSALSLGASLGDVRVALATSPEESADIDAIYRQVAGRGASDGEIALYEGALGLGIGWTLGGVRWDIAHSAPATAAINGIYQQMLGHSSNDDNLLLAYEANMGASWIKWTVNEVRWDLAHRPEAAGAINDVYHQVLLRDPNSAEMGVYQWVLGQGWSQANIRYNLAHSDEAASDINTIYQQVLGRDAGDGIAGQEAGLMQGLTMADVRHNVATSPELAQGIAAAFHNEYGREAQPGDLAYWESVIEQGLATFQGMRTAFAHTAEATTAVTALYAKFLGRGPGPAELAWAEDGNLAQGVTIEALSAAISHSAEARADFDAAYYLAQNPDVAAAGVDPYLHYISSGWREGRNPSALFNTNYYLQQNPDVAAAGINPLLHYRVYGWHEGRDPSAQFSTRAYLAANPDVAAAGIDPLAHYVNNGRAEGRAAHAATPDATVILQAVAIDAFYFQMFARPALSIERGMIEMAARAGQTLDQVLATLRATPGFQDTQTAIIHAFYQANWHRDANADELTNIKGATAAGQSLLVIEQMLTPSPTPTTPPTNETVTTSVNAFYQQLFGRNALGPEVETISAALAQGQTLAQILGWLRAHFAYSSYETVLLQQAYSQVTGQALEEDDVLAAEDAIYGGASLADVRSAFAHSDATIQAVDQIYLDLTGRDATSAELAAREGELSAAGSLVSMRTDLALNDAEVGRDVDRIYSDVVDHGADGSTQAYWRTALASSTSLGGVRWAVAHGSEAELLLRTALGQVGPGVDAPTLAMIEAGLSAGASFRSIEAGFGSTVQSVSTYDTHGDVTSLVNVWDPNLTARNVARGFFRTVLGRDASSNEMFGVQAAVQSGLQPNSAVTAWDAAGHVLGQTEAGKLLIELPVFIAMNGGVAPLLTWFDGGGGSRYLSADGAQGAGFLLALEGMSGRMSPKELGLYAEVANWLATVGQQLLQLSYVMGRASQQTQGDRQAIALEISKLALSLASMPIDVRETLAANGATERITLGTHRADVTVFRDPATGDWTYRVHDIENPVNWFLVAVQAVALVASVVLLAATAGGSAPVTALLAGEITAASVAAAVAITADLVLAGNAFANGDVLGGLLSLAAAAGSGLAGLQAADLAQAGKIILAARAVVGAAASSVQAAERGNGIGIATGVLQLAAAAAAVDVAVQGSTASASLVDVAKFLTGVSTAAGVANAVASGNVQAALFASLNGVLTAYSLVAGANGQEQAGTDEDATPPIERARSYRLPAYPTSVLPAAGPPPIIEVPQIEFSTPERAAQHALNLVNPTSIATNTEYAGKIFYNPTTGMFYAVNAFAGTNTSALVPYNPNIDSYLVGDYHTHGNYSAFDESGNLTSVPKAKDGFNSDNFSLKDKFDATAFALRNGLSHYKIYLGTPSGSYLSYNTATGAVEIIRSR